MRAARYFGQTGHTCTYCKHRRFHTAQEHTREFTRHIETIKAARRRRAPGAPDFDGQCVKCLRSEAHTDGEHNRQIQMYLDDEAQIASDPDDFRDHYYV